MEVVKAGDIVKVKVLEVDEARKRISLTMRLDEKVTAKPAHANKPNKAEHHSKVNKPANQASNKAAKKQREPSNAMMGNAFAEAFAKLKK